MEAYTVNEFEQKPHMDKYKEAVSMIVIPHHLQFWTLFLFYGTYRKGCFYNS
jgi:hypothetical protein